MKKLTLLAPIALTLLIVSCKKEKEPEPEPEFCDTISARFTADISPILMSNCAVSGCHDGSNPDIPLEFNNYSNSKLAIENNQALFLAAINFSGEDEAVWMPRPEPDVAAPPTLKLPQSMIDKIECWIDAGMPNN
jgi:hypothetical protein